MKITKITISPADGKDIELTIDEARELHRQLDELYGNKTLPVYIDRPIIRDYVYQHTTHPWVTWTGDINKTYPGSFQCVNGLRAPISNDVSVTYHTD